MMVSRKEIAAEKKRCNSHNCAQAILHMPMWLASVRKRPRTLPEPLEAAWAIWKGRAAHLLVQVSSWGWSTRTRLSQ